MRHLIPAQQHPDASLQIQRDHHAHTKGQQQASALQHPIVAAQCLASHHTALQAEQRPASRHPGFRPIHQHQRSDYGGHHRHQNFPKRTGSAKEPAIATSDAE